MSVVMVVRVLVGMSVATVVRVPVGMIDVVRARVVAVIGRVVPMIGATVVDQAIKEPGSVVLTKVGSRLSGVSGRRAAMGNIVLAAMTGAMIL